MAIFLEVQDAYRLIQRELPEGAYADGSPSAFYTTASVYAKATLLSQTYENMRRIYDNMFPQSTFENILEWEDKVFGYHLDDALSLGDQRDAIILKMRQHPGINRKSIQDIIATQLGPLADFEVIDYNCGAGGWILDESQLDINTFLNVAYMVNVTPYLYPNADFCVNDPAFGLTDQEWLDMRIQAYTYEVRIYSQVLTADQRFALDQALSQGEPARSAHNIVDGLDPNDKVDGEN